MIICLLFASTLAHAEVRITCDKPSVRSREECMLKVTAEGGGEHAWRWSVRGAGSTRPILRPVSGNEARFTGPPTLAGNEVTVLVEDARNPSIRAEFRVAVAPSPKLGCTDWQEKDERIPGAFTPSLCPFQGDPTAAPTDAPHELRASRICFVEDAFADGPRAMRALHRCWIVAGSRGLQAYSLGGEAIALPIPQQSAGRICRAVAVLPPGASPGAGAPRLVYAESTPDPFAPEWTGDGDTRIYALERDGTRRELPLGEAGTLGGPRTVRDLALDRKGNTFAALSGGRGIWKIDTAGLVSLHALVPEPDEGDSGGSRPDGLRALILEASTGDLYAADGHAVWRVTPAGAASPVLPSRGGPALSPCHLALHGRELLIADAYRQEVHAFHLDTGKLAMVLGSAGGRGCAPTRLGPLQGFHAGLPAESCAVLGATGSLASNQEGLCLLGAGAGLALLDLPGKPLTQDLPARKGTGRPSALAPAQALTTRQANRERSRSSQTQIRQYKRELRLGRKLAAQNLERATAAGAPPQPAPAPRRPALSLRRVGLVALLAYGTLWNPSALGAEALAAPPSLIDFQRAKVAAGMDQLALSCAPALAFGTGAVPCAPGYRGGVVAQMDSLFEQMEALLVAPESLGAGACVAGESEAHGKARIALAQGDVLARYDGLIADATALEYQMFRDGSVLQTAGFGLLAGQALATALGVPATGSRAIPRAGLGVAGHSLLGSGFALQGLGGILGGKTANKALVFRARYQRYANAQTERILRNCTGEAPASSGAKPLLSAHQSAVEKLEGGCALSRLHLLDLQVCSPASLEAFRKGNGTAPRLSGGAACLASGLLQGRQGPCPHAPLSDDRTRSDTFAYLTEFAGEIGDAASDRIAASAGLNVAAQSLFAAADLVAASGNATDASTLAVVAFSLTGAGTGTVVDEYELLRITALSQRWRADITLAFNAESRDDLDEKEEEELTDGPVSSTGAALSEAPVRSSASSDPQGTAAASSAPAASSTTPARALALDSGDTQVDLIPNDAGRPLPVLVALLGVVAVPWAAQP